MTEQLQPPATERTYGYVVCQVIRRVADSPQDGDDKPDVLPGAGSIRFTPDKGLVTSSDYSAYVVREIIDAPLDATGSMVRHKPKAGEQLEPGLWLAVGVYHVSFRLTSGQIKGVTIEVKPEHTKESPLDLVTVAPYEPPSGVTVQTLVVPQVPDGSVLVKNGDSFDALPASEFKGEQGPKGDPGAIGRESDYLLVGPGRPDSPASTGGLVTGKEPVGCEFRSTDGADVGAWVWRKRPTGWQLVDGDELTQMEMRSIPADPGQGWTKGTLVARRRGGVVTVHAYTLTRDAASGSRHEVGTLPAGWRPRYYAFFTTRQGVTACVAPDGQVALYGPGTTMDYLYCTYLVD